MDIGPESDLLPLLFDQVVETYSNKTPGAQLRARIVRQLLRAVEEAAAHEVNAARIRSTDAIDPNDYPPLITYDRLSGTNLSRSALVCRIAAALELSTQLLEVAILMIEAHLDLALATQETIVVRGIVFSYLETQSQKTGRESVDHTIWTRELHERLLKGITTDRFFQIGKSKRSADTNMLSQGLLVGAAFRIAAPLQIRVPEYAIESIIEGLDKSKPEIRILQISDLHFGDDIYDTGGKRAKSGFMKTHDFNAAIELGEAVQEMDRRYDILVATGDLTTHGRRRELLNAMAYISGAAIPGPNPGRLAANALKASKGKRILLPGNHDLYGPAPLLQGQKPKANTMFEDVLDLPRTYPYVVGFRTDREDETALTVLFFVFNSSLAEEISDPLQRLAIGNVSKAERSRALELSKRIVKERQVDDLYGKPMKFNPTNSVRIGLLHHHPLLREELSEDFEFEERITVKNQKNGLDRIKGLFSKFYKDKEEYALRLKESSEFIEACWQSGIQIVLFGHRHEAWGGAYNAMKQRADQTLEPTIPDEGSPMTPFGKAPEHLHFLCCPSTLEHTAKKKGFFVLDVANLNEIRVSIHVSSIQEDKMPSPFMKTKEIEFSISESAVQGHVQPS